MATKNLGQVSAIHIGALEPQNKNLIWRDISQNPNLWKLWNSLDSVWEVVPSQTVVNNFINLGDTPISYQGSGGKILKVKANLSGIEFDDEVTFLSEINEAANKAIVDDSDEFLLSDAGTVKKTLWGNIKSTIKAYFDTLYVSVSDVTSQLISNWNTAYGWGDHSAEGYLKTETDPVFLAHPASNVINSGAGNKYLSDDGGYKDLYHNDLLDRGDTDSHPQTAITGLVAKLIELEKSNPVRYVRFFRSATEELFGETYYTSTEEEGTGAVLDISQAITATAIATADHVAQFSGIPVPAGTEFTIRQINTDILARKNATSRVVSLFAEFWDMDAAGALTQLGTSNVLTLSENAESKPLFFSLSSEHTPAEGSRAVIIFRAFQTGTGVSANATISIEDQTGSRWSFDTVIQADGGGHIFEDSTDTALPTRSVAKAGEGIEFEDDAVNEKTVVRVDDTVSTKPDSFTENHIKTFDEDGNDKDSGIDITQLNTNQTISFDAVLPFDHVLTVMQPHTVTGAIHFSANTNGLVDGSKVIVVLTANGSNVPTFGGEFTATADSLQYSNIPGDKNTIEFFYDGDGYRYRISNTAGSNLAYKNQVLLTTNETPFEPTMDYQPTTRKFVLDEIVKYVANYYPGIPTPSGQELGYYGIKWNSAYPNSGCLRTGTLSGYQGGGYFNEPAYTLTHRPLSNVPNNLLFVQNKIRRCIANVDGTVNYYLDSNNSYNKYGELPSIFGTVTTAGRTSLISTGSFTLASDNYIGRYIHITTSGKANIYAMVTSKVSDNELTVIDPRRNVTTGNIFEIGDTFELCTAVLNGSDGDVMVYIPKFYQRYTRVGTENTLDIALYPYAGFNVHPAFVENGVEKDYILYSAFGAYLSGGVGISRAEVVPTTSRTRAANRNDAASKGSGWVQEMFWYRSAIQVLFFVEYADLNSDFRLPAFQHRSSFSINDIRYTGRTLFAGDNSVSIFQDTDFYDTDISLAGWTENDCVGMSYRGIENFYGSLWNWTDGVNLNSGQVYITNNKNILADDTELGYDDPNLVWLQQTSFIREVHPVAGAFIPSLGGGSASTYFCDQNYYAMGWRVVRSGGSSYHGLSAGAVGWTAHSGSSYANAIVGSRLCF